MSDFRTATGRNPVWHQSNGAFSNFEFVDKRFQSNAIVRRILSLARKCDYTSFLQETIEESDCALLAEENQALAARVKDFRGAKVTRLSFFRSAAPGNGGDFLGYAIVKEDHFASGASAHVYESVMTPPRGPKQNNFVHCARKYQVANSHGKFEVCGVLYAQQNDATFVCAHVALRTVLSTILPNSDVSYHAINDVLKVDHADPGSQFGKLAGGQGRGVNPDQMEAVLRHYGLSPEKIVHEPNHGSPLPSATEFQRLLYGYIESTSPALLGFELSKNPKTNAENRHIIPIFGHTFNEDLWAPEAERNYFGKDRGYFPSENWLSSYLAHDDNFGPYVCLPRHYLSGDEFRLLISWHIPPVALPSELAEALAVDFIVHFSKNHVAPHAEWYGRMKAFAIAGLLVLRSVLLSKAEYIDHLKALRDREGRHFEQATIDRFATNLPAHVWMVEASAPELFPASRRKFGEIVFDALQAPKPPNHNFLLFRAPGTVVFNGAGGIQTEASALIGHTPLYNHA